MSYQIFKNHPKLFTMVGDIFDIYVAQMSKNDLKSSSVVRENSKNSLAQMSKNHI